MANLTRYFDYAATTPVHQEVLQAMAPFFSESFGNPSSAHMWGQEAFSAVEESRGTIARLFDVNALNVVFTGCSTEASNMLVHSRVMNYWNGHRKACRVITTPLEHSAVLHPLHALHEQGFCELDILPVDEFGMVDPDDVRKLIRADTVLVTAIWANNEIGTINPIKEIGKVCKEAGVWFHSDATQFAAHRHCSLVENNVNSVAISAHKAYGPKGVGALICNNIAGVTSLIYGGLQENSHRAGTSNVPYIVGMAKAFDLLDKDMITRTKHEVAMRDLIIMTVLNNVEDSRLTGHPVQRLTNLASFAFKNVDSRLLQALLDQDGFAVSVGSACKAGTGRGLLQLQEIGLPDEWGIGGLRITNGLHTRAIDVKELAISINRCVTFLREQ